MARVSASRTSAGRRVLDRNYVSSLSNAGSTSAKTTVTATSNLNGLTAVSNAFFMKPYSGGGGGLGRIFHKGPNSLGYLDVFMPSTGRLSFNADWITTDLTCLLDVGLKFGRWYHVVVTYSGVVGEPCTFYINGAVASSSASSVSSGARASDSTSLIIGNWVTSTVRYYDGLLHSIQVYNSVLNATQVADLYYDNKQPSGLIEGWTCGDASGTTLAASVNSSNNGSISNASFVTETFTKSRTVAGPRTTEV